MRTKRSRHERGVSNEAAVARYWSRRLKHAGPLAAVLTYDAPPAINRAYDRWERESLLRQLPASLDGKTALDLGCGSGRVAVLLAGRGATVTGVDISPVMLEACRTAARRARVSRRLTLIESSVSKLIPNLGKFDIVTCFGLLEHLWPKERHRCLHVALANLNKSGRIFLVVNNPDGVFLRTRKSGSDRRVAGHYVSMVGLRWLEKFCNANGAAMTVLAANPFYAWLHYGLLKGLAVSFPEAELNRLAQVVTPLDLAATLRGPLPYALASHFMVELRRRGV
ncbi:MAG: class I SAM-dependent methyltransferase [Candidatus Zixiibacteriota bacterium]